MAGRRRGTGKPLQREVKAQRTRARYQARLAGASSAAARLAVACDYVRAGLGPAPAGPLVADLVDRLLEAGDQIAAARRRQRVAAELAAAVDGRERVTIAARYLRAAAGQAPVGRVAELTETTVADLVRAAERQIGGR